MLFAERLDFDIDARGKIELHQRIYGLLRRLEDVEQALVSANLELLTRFLVHVRRTQHAVLVLHRGQWNRTRDLCARTTRGFDDLTRGLVQDAVVVGFQPDTNSFFSNHVRLSLTPSGIPEGKNLRRFTRRLSRVPKSRAKRGISWPPALLLNDFRDGAGAYGVAAFTNREA